MINVRGTRIVMGFIVGEQVKHNNTIVLLRLHKRGTKSDGASAINCDINNHIRFDCVYKRREAVSMRVRRLRPTLRQQLRPEEALARPHDRQAVRLPARRLRQVLHASVVAS